MSFVKSLIKLSRPRQWVKNSFVFTALIFSGQVLNVTAVAHSLIAFAAFCLLSSGIYFLNDFKDIREDRLHPTKCHRPLANGDLPAWAGIVGFFVLAGSALALCFFQLNTSTMFVLCAYLAVNIGYSMGLKHLVIIDVVLISSGFLLRIIAGAATISVSTSKWLILCGVTISLFLGFTKRRVEIVLLGEKAKEHRRVLAYYNTDFLDQVISIVTASTVVCYILYTVDVRTVHLVGSHLLVVSVPLVLYGILRYLYLVYNTSSNGDPSKIILTDRPLLLTVFLWGTVCTFIILFGERIKLHLL